MSQAVLIAVCLLVAVSWLAYQAKRQRVESKRVLFLSDKGLWVRLLPPSYSVGGRESRASPVSSVRLCDTMSLGLHPFTPCVGT